MTAEERFWPKVGKTDGCWFWTAAKTGDGYGRFRDGTRLVLAHRFAYQLLVGPVPAGLELDHLCRTPSCVNPAHLEPVTHAENMQRGLLTVMNGSWHRAKTQCPQGHPYDVENTYRDGRGRQCRSCNREAQRRYAERKPA